MPRARPCMVPRCPNVVTTRRPYCDDHRDVGDYDRRSWPEISAAHLAVEPDCRHCGEPGQLVDHIVPRSQGGSDDESNLQTLCRSCHGRKIRTEG